MSLSLVHVKVNYYDAMYVCIYMYGMVYSACEILGEGLEKQNYIVWGYNAYTVEV